MDDGAALLTAILQQPDEDTPRLIYADWLDEHGEAWDRDRAELIRIGVELATAPKCLSASKGCGCRTCTLDARSTRLKTRSHHRATNEERWWWRELRLADSLLVRRGFVESIGGIETVAFLQNAAFIFAGHPITGVSLTDREPFHDSGPCESPARAGRDESFDWWDARNFESTGGEYLPGELWELLVALYPEHVLEDGIGAEFDSEASAFAVLSEICVAYGRSRAGLPPLSSRSIASQMPAPSS